MSNQDLRNIRVAVLAMDGVEEIELTDPVNALIDAGATVDVISATSADIQAFSFLTPTIRIGVDRTFDEVSPDDYDALLLPGGALNADALRVLAPAQAFVASFDNADKPIAAICHGPWLLASADLLQGRMLTGSHTIHDDIENAGGTWVDSAVVSDGNLVTSRQPSDIVQFNARMLTLFATALEARPLQLL